MNKLKELGFAGFFSEVLDPDNYYTKEEIINLLSQIETPSYLEVNTLPAVGEPNVIYLLPKQGGGKEQWIYSNGQWIDIGGTDIDLSQYVKKSEVVDMMYPIGSTLIMPTNTNPNTLYPGTTWELYDKDYRYQWKTDAFMYSGGAADVRDGQSVAIFSGKTIEVRLSFKNAVPISDDVFHVCSTTSTMLGMVSNGHAYYTTGYCDALNATALARFTWTVGTSFDDGRVEIADWVTRGTSYPTAIGEQCYIQWTMTAPSYQYMTDSFCDKFYFRRTA